MKRALFRSADIARALDARKVGAGWMARCPAHEDRTPSLSIAEGGDGRPLLKCHAGCAQSTVFDAVMERLHCGVAHALPSPSSLHSAARRTTQANEIWQNASPAAGTLAEAYLQARAITIFPPPSLRFIPDAYHTESKQSLPALVAAVTAWPSAEVVAIQRIFVRYDGSGKAAVSPVKKCLGPVSGGAVRLGDATARLAICEGVEDGLSIMQLDKTLPVWAGLGAANMKRIVLPPLPRAAEVIIVADNDANGVGAREANAAGERFTREGRSVRIARAPACFKDFNDALSAARPHPDELDEAQRCDFEERAAIHEYDAGLERWLAESFAWTGRTACSGRQSRGHS